MYDHIAKLRTRKIDNKVVHNLVAMAIIEHDIPFFFFFLVEYRTVRELLKYLSPKAKFYSRHMATLDVINNLTCMRVKRIN